MATRPPETNPHRFPPSDLLQEIVERETALEWLRRARSNLIRARQPKPQGVFWEDLSSDRISSTYVPGPCFLAVAAVQSTERY